MGDVHLSWPDYAHFLLFAVLLTVAPGPDLAVIMKSALRGGRPAGLWAMLGVNVGNALQGTAAALGLGALIVASRPVFETVRWAGIAYLSWLGLQALRSALRSPRPGPSDPPAAATASGWRRQFAQGLLCDLTNPKILVFYLSVLPQFLPAHATIGDALALANTLAVLGLCWFSLVVAGIHMTNRWLSRTRVQRGLNALTGTALLGFAGKIAADGA